MPEEEEEDEEEEEEENESGVKINTLLGCGITKKLYVLTNTIIIVRFS
jgi:hypothetical protein